jgi:hypothetical protein
MPVATEELWMIRGNSPVLWTVPFYITKDERHEEFAMFSAIPLLPNQKKAVDELLLLHARQWNGMWRILPIELAAIGYATEGGDPEEYFSWERKRVRYKTDAEKERRKEMDDFLDALYQKGFGQSRMEVEGWWLIFSSHALDWMLNKDRIVDFGFIRLHPTYYRRNWQECLVHKLWQLSFVYRRFYVPRMAKRLWREKIKERFTNPGELALDESGIFLRHVDIEHTREWRKKMRMVENARKNVMKDDYADFVMGQIRSRVRTAYKFFRYWAKDAMAPRAKSVRGSPGRGHLLVPAHSAMAGRYEWVETYTIPELLASYEKALRKNGKPPEVSAKNGGLPTMRIV